MFEENNKQISATITFMKNRPYKLISIDYFSKKYNIKNRQKMYHFLRKVLKKDKHIKKLNYGMITLYAYIPEVI